MLGMRSPRNFLPFVFVSLLCGNAIYSQEWTRFRGPNGSGRGTALELPATITEKDFNWRIKLPGHGHSSPVIWGDRVFVSSTPEGTAKRIFSCLDTATGKSLWQREYATGTFRQHSDNSYSAASPALDAERIYAWWDSPEGSALVALDQKDGREIWRRDLGPFVSQHGSGASPIVFENLVILNFDQDQPGSYVIALDAATGKERWKLVRDSKSSSASTPCIFTPEKGPPQLILTGRTTGVTGLNPRTGEVLWQMTDLMPRRCVASPIITDAGAIIAQCGEGSAESLVAAVKPGLARQPPSKLYEIVRVGGYVPTPIAVGELLFLFKDNGLVTCLRAHDREQLWSERVEGGFYGSPMCVGDRLYNITRRGDLVIIRAGDKFELLARVPLGEGSHASPSVSGGRMYLRTFTHLISIGQ